MNGMNPDFLSNLYKKPVREIKPKSKTEDKVRISQFDSPFRKVSKQHFIRVIYGFVALTSRKTGTNVKKEEQKQLTGDNYYQKKSNQKFSTMELLTNKLVSHSSA